VLFHALDSGDTPVATVSESCSRRLHHARWFKSNHRVSDMAPCQASGFVLDFQKARAKCVAPGRAVDSENQRARGDSGDQFWSSHETQSGKCRAGLYGLPNQAVTGPRVYEMETPTRMTPRMTAEFQWTKAQRQENPGFILNLSWAGGGACAGGWVGGGWRGQSARRPRQRLSGGRTQRGVGEEIALNAGRSPGGQSRPVDHSQSVMGQLHTKKQTLLTGFYCAFGTPRET